MEDPHLIKRLMEIRYMLHTLERQLYFPSIANKYPNKLTRRQMFKRVSGSIVDIDRLIVYCGGKFLGSENFGGTPFLFLKDKQIGS